MKAWAIPPPVSPKVTGVFVNRSRLRAGIPLISTEIVTIPSTATASPAASSQAPSTARLIRLRRRTRPPAESSVG